MILDVQAKMERLKFSQFQISDCTNPFLISVSVKKTSKKFKKRSEYTDKEFIE